MRQDLVLDVFDWKLLDALQDDGRLTNQQLADRVGLSPSQCSRRRLRLEADGLIAGYRATLDAEKLGLTVTAFIHVSLANHSPDNARRFLDLVERIAEIQEAYSLTGEADYLVKAVVGGLRELSRLVNDVLLPHGSVAHLRSSIVLDRLKSSPRLPLPPV